MAESKKKTAGTAKAASAKTKNKNNEKKTGRGGSSARQKPQAPKSASKQGSARADSTKTDTTPPAISQGGALLGALLLTLLGLFCGAALLFAAQTGTVGLALHNLLLGLFGCAAYVVPVLLLIEAAFFKKDVEYHAMPHKCISACCCLPLRRMFSQLPQVSGKADLSPKMYFSFCLLPLCLWYCV